MAVSGSARGPSRPPASGPRASGLPLVLSENNIHLRHQPAGIFAEIGDILPPAQRIEPAVEFALEPIDQAAGLSGSVVFKVLLEGGAGQWSVAYQSPIIRGGDAPLPVTVDLKGSTRMALLVDFADRGDECDYANWLQARLVK